LDFRHLTTTTQVEAYWLCFVKTHSTLPHSYSPKIRLLFIYCTFLSLPLLELLFGNFLVDLNATLFNFQTCDIYVFHMSTMTLMFLSATSTSREKTLNHFCFTYVLLGANRVVRLLTSAYGMSNIRFTKLKHQLPWLECDKSSKFVKFV